MILSDEEEGYNLRLRKWLIFHLYMCVLCSVLKKMVHDVIWTFCQIPTCVGILCSSLGGWHLAKILFSLSLVDASHSC